MWKCNIYTEDRAQESSEKVGGVDVSYLMQGRPWGRSNPGAQAMAGCGKVGLRTGFLLCHVTTSMFTEQAKTGVQRLIDNICDAPTSSFLLLILSYSNVHNLDFTERLWWFSRQSAGLLWPFMGLISIPSSSTHFIKPGELLIFDSFLIMLISYVFYLLFFCTVST